jgi:branched-chain amino acid transport system substrate-binding protein
MAWGKWLRGSSLFMAGLAASLALSQHLAAAQDAKPELRVGAVFALTGPASALGIPAKNAIQVLEEQLAQKNDLPFRPHFIVYDDASDPTKAVNAVRKLVAEDRVHLVICCSTTPASMAILETINSSAVPNISVASAATIIEPAAERKWTFKTPTTDRLQIMRVADDMVARGIKKIAFFGQEDSYGEGGWNELKRVAKEKSLEIIAAERFARTDTNFTPQALKIKQANPDAVYFHAIPPASALAQQALRRVGYAGPTYHGGGSANVAFIALAKEAAERAIVGTGPLLIYRDLPDSYNAKPEIIRFSEIYGKKFGADKIDIFPGQAWDAGRLAIDAAERAVKAGADLSKLEDARQRLRDAVETTKDFPGVDGIFNYSATDHLGLDLRSTFLAEVKGGKFVLYRR